MTVRHILFCLITCFYFCSLKAQNSKAQCFYTITINEQNLNTISIEMRIPQAHKDLSIAFFAHPEYDDKYWRYITDLMSSSTKGTVPIIRKDNTLWQLQNDVGAITITYKIQLPQDAFRAAWKPFLRPSGGLIDGTHLLFFIPGQVHASSNLQLVLPKSWEAITMLPSGTKPFSYAVPNVNVLMDAPILMGHFKKWTYRINNIPHDIAYWVGNDTSTFDEKKLVTSAQNVSRQAALLFKGLPYQRYLFIIQDSAWGALEHRDCITLGATKEQVNTNFAEVINELAHEYIHAWNLMRMQPIEYGDVDYKQPPFSSALWFSEGFTVYYADLLVRRAGLPPLEATRLEHLTELLKQYYDSPGEYSLSPELVSKAAYGPQSLLGDYTASTHLQGELIAVLMDIMLRDKTNNQRTLDDLMRSMMQHYGKGKGFTSRDVINILNQLCVCSYDSFYAQNIQGNKPLPFETYLPKIGYQLTIQWKEATDDKGNPEGDKRVYAWHDPKSNHILLGLIDPNGIWGKAGLHTFDTVLKINNEPIKTQRQFFQKISSAKLNDTITLTLKKGTATIEKSIQLSSYQKPYVTITPVTNLTPKQRQLQQIWLSGKP